jgi:hypothetical protein
MSFVALPFVRMKGVTAGVTTGEGVELTPYWPPGGAFTGQSIVLEVRVVATGLVSSNSVTRSFVQRFSIFRDGGGVTHLSGSDTQQQFGDAAGSSWTVAITLGSSPDRLRVIFNTGTTQCAATVTADIYYTVTAPLPGVPTPLVEWRADTYATIASGASTWYSRTPDHTYELVSADTFGLTEVTNWQGGLPGIGYPNAGSHSPSTGGDPLNQAGYGSGIELPLSGNSLTVYMVLDYRDPAPGITGPLHVFSIGYQNDDSNYNEWFIVYVNTQGGASANQPSIDITDNDPSPAYTGEYQSSHPFGAANTSNSFSPSVLVVQTQRSSGHNVILNGTNLPATTSNLRGTIPNFTSPSPYPANPLTVQLAGYHYVLSGVTFAWEAPTYIGHVLIYNAYHSAAQILSITNSLNAFWGL